MNLREKLLAKVSADAVALISPERIEELRAKAKENVDKRRAEKAEKDFLGAEEKRLERALDPRPEYEERRIVIDAASHTEYIRIDDRFFYHGQIYTVGKPVYDQLMDMMERGWRHEREISAPTNRVMSNNRGAVLSGGGDNAGARF